MKNIPSAATPAARFAVDQVKVASLCLIEAVEELHPGAVTGLKDDARHELDTWPEVVVAQVDDDGHTDILGSGCSTAGFYDHRATPPRLVYVDSPTLGRNYFTLLHELAHHLQRDPDWYRQVLAPQRQQGKRLEHRICDRFASDILVPVLDLPSIAASALSAAQIARICTESAASRSAVLVKISEVLPSNRTVFMTDASGTVIFNRPQGSVPPPKRGNRIDTELINGLHEGEHRQGRMNVTYSTGSQLRGLRASVAAAGNYRIIVLTDDSDGRRQDWNTPELWCESCDAPYTTSLAVGCCKSCGEPLCPSCQRCPCSQLQPRLCERCFVLLSVKETSEGRTTHETCT